MKSSSVIAVCLQLSAGLAFPLLRQRDENGVSVIQTAAEEGGMVGGGEGAVGGGAGEGAGEGAGGEEGGEAEEGEENEVEIEAQFDEAVALEGGDIKQDTLFPTGVSKLPRFHPICVADSFFSGQRRVRSRVPKHGRKHSYRFHERQSRCSSCRLRASGEQLLRCITHRRLNRSYSAEDRLHLERRQ